ncbi:MAG: CAP domain-containing protein [Bacteroidota bacterium]
MKHCFFLLTIFILLSCSPKYAPSESVPVSGKTEVNGNMEESILGYINAHRRSKGLAKLQMSDIASQQAYQHSKNMATGKTGFGHNGFDQRIQNIKKAMGTTFMAASAENVAYGQLSAKEVVQGWLKSAPHKKNIEGNYNLTGIGLAKDRTGDIYFTQIFLRK